MNCDSIYIRVRSRTMIDPVRLGMLVPERMRSDITKSPVGVRESSPSLITSMPTSAQRSDTLYEVWMRSAGSELLLITSNRQARVLGLRTKDRSIVRQSDQTITIDDLNIPDELLPVLWPNRVIAHASSFEILGKSKESEIVRAFPSITSKLSLIADSFYIEIQTSLDIGTLVMSEISGAIVEEHLVEDLEINPNLDLDAIAGRFGV
jgi:hypothetical protein